MRVVHGRIVKLTIRLWTTAIKKRKQWNEGSKARVNVLCVWTIHAWQRGGERQRAPYHRRERRKQVKEGGKQENREA